MKKMFSMFSDTSSFSALRQQFADRFLRALIAQVIRCRIVIGSPWHVDGSRHDQQILRAQVMSRLSHQPASSMPRARSRQDRCW